MANYSDNSTYDNAPREIGDVLQVTCIEAATMVQVIMKIFLFIIIILLGPVAIIWIFVEIGGQLRGVMTSALTMSVLGIYWNRKAFKVSFEGADYFLGENGFSVIRFKKTRDNVISTQTVLFKDLAFLMSSGKDNKFGATDFYFAFFNKASETGTYVYDVAYTTSDTNVGGKSKVYLFWEKVEQQWTSFFINQQQDDDMVSFPVLKGETLYPNEITVGPDYLDISGTRYDRGCIKEIHYNNDSCTFEHTNHTISVMKGFVEKGDMSTIKLSELGNRNALFELLSVRGMID